MEVVKSITNLKQLAWRHPIRSIALLLVVIAAIFIGIWWFFGRTYPVKISSNPVIASYQKQLPGLKSAVDKNGNDVQAHYNYAVALYATGDLSAAKAQYETAAKLSPNDSNLQNSLGNVYRDLHDYSKAESAYNQAIKLNSKAVNPYINLANLYLYALRKKDQAIKTYQDALHALPGNQDLEVLLAICYEQMGDKTNARQTYQQVLSQNPSNAAAQAGLQRV